MILYTKLLSFFDFGLELPELFVIKIDSLLSSSTIINICRAKMVLMK